MCERKITSKNHLTSKTLKLRNRSLGISLTFYLCWISSTCRVYYSRHPRDTVLILTFKHSSTVLGQSQLAHQCFFAGFHGSTKCEQSYWLCCKLVFALGCRQSGCRDPFKSARSIIGMMSPGAPGFTDCWEYSNGFDWTVAECDCCPGRTLEGRRRCKELLMARTKRKYAETKQWTGQGGSALPHTHTQSLIMSV